MDSFIKKNISIIVSIFIMLGPILDLITGVALRSFHINFTLGIIVRVIFLLFICFVILFTFKKKNILIVYLILGLYFILYLLGNRDVGVFKNIQGLIKTFYFPIVLISLYSIRDYIHISRMSLFVTMFIYLIFIFVPTFLGVGYDTYKITKVGSLGFFNSANEISGIISILTPIMFIILIESHNIIPKLILGIMYLVVILMMGTKTPLLTLCIVLFITIVYFMVKWIKSRSYKKIGISLCVMLVGGMGIILIMPRTNFYKNIETHLHFLKLDNVGEVFESEKYIDHFIFSSRLKFLRNRNRLYSKSSTYRKVFGIGYVKSNGRSAKLVEMDYFDIYYSHGIVGFVLYFGIFIYVLIMSINNRIKGSFNSVMYKSSLFLILLLAMFTGHIITTPSVSILAVIIILSINKRSKRRLLFASVNLDLGGIEKASINLLNSIDYNKYDVSLVLEERKGVFLNSVNKNTIVREVRVSNNHNKVIRKVINGSRKLIFKILEYNNFDFSCCYATYSYSACKLSLIASVNNSLYVHSNYEYVYKSKKEFCEFFDSRSIDKFKWIIFVSNEARDSFTRVYPLYSNKCLVINNYIDVNDIKAKSKISIDLKRPHGTLFVFVGRLDDSSKKLGRAINIIKDIPNTILWIVGSGKDEGLYRDLVNKYKLNDRVLFIGSKSNPYPYMREADYIILTSDYEGFPVTYLEGLALNKQIITTINTSDEFINMKDYAFIVSKDNIVSDVKKILKSGKNKPSIDINKLQKSKNKRFEELFDSGILGS